MSNIATRGLFDHDLDELQAMATQIAALAGSVSALLNAPARLELVFCLAEEVEAIADEMGRRLDSNRRMTAAECMA